MERTSESMADFGHVLSKYVDVIVVRAYQHQTVVELAEHCTCSVINGLTDFAHPCQAIADLYTLRELAGTLEGHTLAWVGDANNVARSLALGCGKVGMKMTMATPEAYQFDEAAIAWIKQQAIFPMTNDFWDARYIRCNHWTLCIHCLYKSKSKTLNL